MSVAQSLRETRQHFRELHNIYSTSGIGEAIKYDYQKTKERGYVPAAAKALLPTSAMVILSYAGVCGVESLHDKKPFLESLIPLSSNSLLPIKVLAGFCFISNYSRNYTNHKRRSAVDTDLE